MDRAAPLRPVVPGLIASLVLPAPTLADHIRAARGALASYGLGDQTASCSYTDAGGLTASASATYAIVDPTTPTIGDYASEAHYHGFLPWYAHATATVSWTLGDNVALDACSATGGETTVLSDGVTRWRPAIL